MSPWAESLSDEDRAHVARHGDHVGDGNTTVGVVVVNDLPRQCESSEPGVDSFVGADHTRLEGASNQEDLERGAGLDGVVKGPGAGLRVVELAEEIGVEARGFGQGQDVTGPRVEHHHDAAPGPRLLDAALQCVFYLGLERGVDGESDVAAGGILRVGPLHDEQPAFRVAFDRNRACAPAQGLVLLLFDGPHALAIDVGEAQQVGGQRTCRIGAARLVHDARSRECSGPDSLGLLRTHPALDEGEAIAVAQSCSQAPGVQSQNRGEGAGRRLDLFELAGNDVDRGSVERDRELDPVAVQDETALRRQREGGVTLLVPALASPRVPHGEVGGAGGESESQQ